MIIVIEGNIGAGKSDLCRVLCSELGVCNKQVEYIEEPLSLWTDMNGENILKLFYQNKNRWAFTFQVNVLCTMLSNSLKAISLSKEGKIVIMERSLFSSTEIFSKVLSEDIFSSVETVAFQNLKLIVPNDFQLYSNKIQVYIKTEPNICLERINRRSRPEEIGNISIDYLNRLHDTYEKMIHTQNDYKQIIEIEGNYRIPNDGETKDQGLKCLIDNLLSKLE